MSPLPSRVHIIGICGVATSALAIALHKKGVAVTGSDKGFYPPVSTHLSDAGVPFHAGWHPEKIEAAGRPDLIVAGGGGTSLSNPEVIYAKENGIPLLSFAEAIERFVIRPRSIVVTGTWGKTTISALLSYILVQGGYDPSYFTGGVSISHGTSSITDSKWSVVEGDEYQIAIWDKRPKFAVYKPTHLLLTGVAWDHADLYPTEAEYFAAFEKLTGGIPADGLIVACADDEGVSHVLGDASTSPNKAVARVVRYGSSASANYRYHSVQPSRHGLSFKISCKTASSSEQEYDISTPIFGRFNAENITAAFAMAHTIGMDATKVVQAIKSFQGIKRRFEKRLDGDITIFDCHAPTPDKAASVLQSLREVYQHERITVVYEPNIGGRQRSSADAYAAAFKDASSVIIPRLTTLKVATGDADKPFEGAELATKISETHPDVVFIEDDAELVQKLVSDAKKGDVIAFLGSHGFRGMIEETVKKLS